MPLEYTIPGVYHETLPRPAPLPLPRTDVVGLAGFERRVRDGSTPSALTGSPLAGHSFQVDVLPFEVKIAGERRRVPAAVDLPLSSDETSIPMAPGETVVYALAAAPVTGAGRPAELLVVAGLPTAAFNPPPPTDEEVAVVAGDRPFV